MGYRQTLAGWHDKDVVGIHLAVTMLMAENQRTGFVWSTFMGKCLRNAGEAPIFLASGLGVLPKRLRTQKACLAHCRLKRVERTLIS
jgi:hypothetical protein